MDLSTTLLKDVAEARALLSVGKADTIADALNIMAKNRVHSLLVHDSSGEYVGMVSQVDLLLPVAFSASKEAGKIDAESLKLTVEQCLGATAESKNLYQFFGVEALPTIVEAFCSGVHSVLVKEASSNKAWSVFSQSDLVRFLQVNFSKLPDSVKSLTAESVRVFPPKLLINSTSSVAAAFRDLLINNIRAAAVVKDDKVVGSLSLSDLVGLNADNVSTLLKPVSEFLSEQKRELVTAEAKESFESLLGKFTTSKVHQLWVLEDGKAKGVVSLTDVIAAVFLRADLGPEYFSRHGAYLSYFKYNKEVKSAYESVFNIPITTLAAKKNPLICATATTTMAEALELMAKHKITALPIEGSTKGKFLGIASAMDIIAFLSLGQSEDQKIDSKQLAAPVASCLGATPESAVFFTLKSEHTGVMNVLESLCQGVHRMVFEINEGQYRLLTQTDLVRYFLSQSDKLGAVTDLKVSECVPIFADIKQPDYNKKKRVVFIDQKETAFTAYKKLVLNDTIAAPIVNSSNELVGTLSSSDIRGLTESTLPALNKNVLEYLKEMKIEDRTITVTATDTLSQVMTKMTHAHVHRAWVVETDSSSGSPKNKVVGVISLTDIILALYLDKMLR